MSGRLLLPFLIFIFEIYSKLKTKIFSNSYLILFFITNLLTTHNQMVKYKENRHFNFTQLLYLEQINTESMITGL